MRAKRETVPTCPGCATDKGLGPDGRCSHCRQMAELAEGRR